MDLIGLNPDGTVQFSLTPVPANKMELFILSTSPYMHPRLDSRMIVSIPDLCTLTCFANIIIHACRNPDCHDDIDVPK